MKKLMLLSLLIISLIAFAGCGKDEPNKDTDSDTNPESTTTKDPDTKDTKAPEPKETKESDDKYAMPKEYKYAKPVGYSTPEELGKAVADARNNAFEDEFDSFMKLIYITDKEKQWQMGEYMRMSSLIGKEMLKQIKEKTDREIPKAEFVNADVEGNSGIIHMNDNKDMAIIKIDGKWFVDFQKNFSSMIFADFENTLDYMHYQIAGLKKGMTLKEIEAQVQLEAIWSEAKVIVGEIRYGLDVYSARNDGDISDLNVSDGFVQDSDLIEKLDLNFEMFTKIEYFDFDDFSVEFVTDGKDGKYIIKVDASNGSGGTTGEGPKEGIGSYNSKTGEWTGMLK